MCWSDREEGGSRTLMKVFVLGSLNNHARRMRIPIKGAVR